LDAEPAFLERAQLVRDVLDAGTGIRAHALALGLGMERGLQALADLAFLELAELDGHIGAGSPERFEALGERSRETRGRGHLLMAASLVELRFGVGALGGGDRLARRGKRLLRFARAAFQGLQALDDRLDRLGAGLQGVLRLLHLEALAP